MNLRDYKECNRRGEVSHAQLKEDAMRQELRNKVGKLIAFVIIENNGNATVFDARNLKLGTYEASRNQTRGRNGNLIGFGNLLATMVRD